GLILGLEHRILFGSWRLLPWSIFGLASIGWAFRASALLLGWLFRLPARLPSGLGGSRLGPYWPDLPSGLIGPPPFGAFPRSQGFLPGSCPTTSVTGDFSALRICEAPSLGISKRGSTFKSLPKSRRSLLLSCLPLGPYPWDVDCWRRHPSALGLVIPQGAQTLEPVILQASITFFRSFVPRRQRTVSLPPILNDDGGYE